MEHPKRLTLGSFKEIHEEKKEVKTTLRGRRINLDEEATKSVEAMMAALQEEGGSHLRLHPSKVASWVIATFHEKYFEKEKSRMLEAHLDKKAALLNMIKSLDSDSEASRLEALFKLIRPKTERGTVQTDQAPISGKEES